MAQLIIISWRDIPAQVIAKRGREVAKIQLTDRFQEAVDRAAMRAGKGSSDAYLADWQRSVPVVCADDLEAAAKAAADEIEARYTRLLIEELNADAHGEVDEDSWRVKQTLRRTKSPAKNRNFQKYARQSFVDTLTLYLHGICCDIDVEPGPRQIASRYLRKRLQFLQAEYPQPTGYAVFPEELKN